MKHNIQFMPPWDHEVCNCRLSHKYAIVSYFRFETNLLVFGRYVASSKRGRNFFFKKFGLIFHRNTSNLCIFPSFLDNKSQRLVPVDGSYSQWSSWAACSPSCLSVNSATPFQTRNRTCTNPFPANGGQDCSIYGPGYETRLCQVQICGEWEEKQTNITSRNYGLVMENFTTIPSPFRTRVLWSE